MKKTYKIEVDCANCANKMEEAARRTSGVKNATVNFMTLKMIVEFEEGAAPSAVMPVVLENCTLLRILTAAALLLVLLILRPGQPLAFFLYLIPYLIVGYDVLLKAFRGITRGQVMDESFLMAVATIGAFVLALTKTGDYVEAVAVMLFYQTGELFQSIAVGRSRRSIAALMDIRPDEAFIERDGAFVSVDPDEVEIGTVISVRPGEKIPIDGIITDGRSAVDTAALTGESVPRDVHEGDSVLSGSINLSGLLRIRTTREFGESTASKILDLVENASSSKAPSENFIAKFARIYTPAVCISALILAFVPPLISLVMGQPARFDQWIYRALTFLVISCPCALVISIPLTFFAGLGGASRAGILIKGSNYVETLKCLYAPHFPVHSAGQLPADGPVPGHRYSGNQRSRGNRHRRRKTGCRRK